MNTPLSLLRHPASAAAPSLVLMASVQLEPHDLVFTYTLRGDVAHVRWPEPAGGGAADGLWQHTCFEAFMAAEGERAYREFNFSPSGRWADYAFCEERVRDPNARPAPAPLLDLRHTAAGVELVAVLQRNALPPGPWRVGLSAVVQDQRGHLSHWALHHPRDKPDFHDRAGWTLRLPND